MDNRNYNVTTKPKDCLISENCLLYGGFLSHGGIPSSHPFFHGVSMIYIDINVYVDKTMS